MKNSEPALDRHDSSRTHTVRLSCYFVMRFVFLSCLCTVEAQDRLCIPNMTWFGTPAPVLDGKLTTNNEYQGACQARLGPNSASPDVVLRGMRDAQNLYLLVQANNLDALTGSVSGFDPYAASLVVLTFDDGVINGTHMYEQIQINPVTSNPQ